MAMSNRTKITLGLMVVVVGVVIWQVYDMFGGSTAKAPVIKKTTTTTTTSTTNTMSTSAPDSGSSLPTPKPAQLTAATTAAPTARELELMRMQDELQAKYLAALNELQMLKITGDIAIANEKIMAAKLATVESQKKIVDMLTPPAPPVIPPEAYAKNLEQPSVVVAESQSPNISVISISQIQSQWSAVLGTQGRLFNVRVGDTLPINGGKIVGIDKSGVMLDLNGQRKKLSLVPII